MIKLVFLRHGQSEWNLSNRFAGWTDVDLTELGKHEAKEAGLVLKKEGFQFDMVFTSVLKRSIRTTWITLDAMDRMWIPIINDWRLNERHYGALQGLNKAETAQKHGEEQVKIWRRSYDIPPPPLTTSDERYPGKDPKYASLSKKELPVAESLKETVARVMPFWKEHIIPQLKKKKSILVSAHGNSIRAIVQHLDNMSKEDILELNIPTGIPLVYELDASLKPIKHYYLGDPQAIAKQIAAVANQGKKK